MKELNNPQNPFSMDIVRSYFLDHISVNELVKLYSVSRSTVYRIIRTFASSHPEMVEEMKKKPTPDALELQNNALKSRILELEQSLRQSQMRCQAYDTMINVAEEIFNIPIRKKSGPKQ